MILARFPRLAACLVVVMGLSVAASAADLLVENAKSQPESLTVAPGGVLIVGSASSPFVYKVPAGSASVERFVDASSQGPGTFFFGMLADPASKILWTCQLTPVPNTDPVRRHTALRGFDLSTAAPRIRWNLPGDNSTCNDFSIGPHHALYITDTANGRIFRLPAGASTAKLLLEDPQLLKGIDGITFLGGKLYVNNVITNKIYRIPLDRTGKAGHPVEIQLDQPVNGPDGMRAANGKLFLAENRSGKIAEIAVNGDKGAVTVLKVGLNVPTGVQPAGGTLWFTERGAGRVESIPMPR